MPAYTANELDRRRRVRKERVKLARQIAAASGEDVSAVSKFLDALVRVAGEMLRKRKACLLHKIVKLRMKSQDARAEGFKNICGRTVPLRALPKRNIVICGITRGFTAALERR